MIRKPRRFVPKKLTSRLRTRQRDQYTLRLYVAGTTPRSSRAVANIRDICEHNLSGRYDLEIIDIYQNPELAVGEQIIAAPTLIKLLPIPLRRFIGDLSDTQRILVGMDLTRSEPTSAPDDE